MARFHCMPDELNACKNRNTAYIDYEEVDPRIADIVRFINSGIFGVQTSGFHPATIGGEKSYGMFALACSENAFRRLFSLYQKTIHGQDDFQLIFTRACEKTLDGDGNVVGETIWPIVIIKYFPQSEEMEKKQLELLTEFFHKLA